MPRKLIAAALLLAGLTACPSDPPQEDMTPEMDQSPPADMTPSPTVDTPCNHPMARRRTP